MRSTVGNDGLSKAISSKGKTYFIQQSIGQASVIGLYSKNNYTIRQGFLQPPNSGKTQSIDIVENNLDAKIFPNPFQQDIRILFDAFIDKEVHIVAYNMSGKVVFSAEYPALQLINVSLNNITNGNYIIKIRSGNKQFVTKLTKQ